MQAEAKKARADQIKLDSEQLERLLFHLFERKVGPMPSSTTLLYHDMTFSIGQTLAEHAVRSNWICAESSMWFAAILENERSPSRDSAVSRLHQEDLRQYSCTEHKRAYQRRI